MKTELYKKVYIKSEDDLPKRIGWYMTLEKGRKELYQCKFTNDEDGRRIWLRDIDWYLQPLASQERIPESNLPDSSPQNDSRDWTEDFSHENGNYLCKCSFCGEYFKGHKRRVICKSCYKKDSEVDQPIHPTSYRDFTMSAEDVLRKHNLIPDIDSDHVINKANRMRTDWYIKAMEEYAQQFKVSDEAIEKWAENEYGCSGTQAIDNAKTK